MRRLVLASSVVSLALVSGAFAADMPVKAPAPMLVVAPSWSGFYVGADLGYAWGRSTSTDVNAYNAAPPVEIGRAHV